MAQIEYWPVAASMRSILPRGVARGWWTVAIGGGRARTAAGLAAPGPGGGAVLPEPRGAVGAGRRVVGRGVDGAAVVDGGTVTATAVVVVSGTVDSVDVGPV